MSQNPKVRVLLVNVDAGGGHRALRDNLIRTLSDNPEIELKVFNSDVKIFEKGYKQLLRVPALWKLVQGIADKNPWYYFMKLAAIVPEIKNADQIMEEFNPDIIVTTNPLPSIVFHNLRRKYFLDYKIVNGIPDYGDQRTYLHINEPADFYLVRDRDTQKALSKYVDIKKLLIYGTTVNPVFEETAKLNKNGIELKFEELFKKYFSNRSINREKKNILILGGAAWAYRSGSLIKKLEKTDKYNIFVSCGSDDKFLKKLQNRPNIFPFPMLPQQDLSVIERFVDIAVLSSFAPATMHELFTINKYPLFVHNIIKGQETPHVPLLSDWNIGIYESNDEKMMFLIEDYLENPEKYEPMLKNMREIRLHENDKAKDNAQIILQIARS